MAKTVLESDLRSILRDESRFAFGTVSFCEFARGGDPGLPDSWIAGTDRWIPCELKRGDGVAKNLRPTQRRWHRSSIELGIRTFGMTLLTTAPVVIVVELQMSSGGLCDLELGRVDANLLQLQHFIGLVGL